MNVQDSIAINNKDLRLFMRRIKKALSDLKATGEEKNSASLTPLRQQQQQVDEIFSSLMED